MKTITALFALLLSTASFSQVKLDDRDFKNLIAISEIYSANNNGWGKDFDKSLAALRTDKLAHIIEVLTIIDGKDKDILTPKYLSRPDNDELQMWYVLREIHYNQQEDNKNPRPNAEVALEVLNKKIDERWLVDNYYYRLKNGVAMLFNDYNLSKINLDLTTYGLKNTTEKAIFFFNISEACIQRFQVLSHLKNSSKLLEFAKKMPKFNGKEYYYYIDFDYEDFEWIGYDKTESYNGRQLNALFNYIGAHFMAAADKGNKPLSKGIYSNSIMSKPEYFKFSKSESTLKEIYNNIKK
jgi:hypothetical protein